MISDVDPDAVALIACRFADRDEVEARVVDVSDPIDPAVLDDDPVATPTTVARVATVVAINVLEHIEDHVSALRGLASLVEPGGTMVIWVPAYMALYGEFDRLVGHVRRYTPQTLTAAFIEAGLEPVTVRPVNVLGGLAWWLVVRKGGTGAPNRRLVAIYNRVVVPITRIVDRIAHPVRPVHPRRRPSAGRTAMSRPRPDGQGRLTELVAAAAGGCGFATAPRR